MKKIICLLVAATMTLGLFVGCDGTNEKQFTAHDLVIALQASGIKIENIISYTEETDSNQLLGRPNQYTSKVSFADTRVEQPEDKSNPVGGSIEVFESEEDATARKEYVEGIASKMSVFSQYFYLYKNILLRIDHDLTPAQASEYESAFKELQ